jgi:DNA-binding NtrC family response regulator
MRHRWPGNVRELRNAVERAYILCDGELDLSEADMPTLRGEVDGAGTVHGNEIHIPIGATLDEIERTFILATLKHFEGDKRRAADVLGCSLKTLYNKLHAYDRERTGRERSTGLN